MKAPDAQIPRSKAGALVFLAESGFPVPDLLVFSRAGWKRQYKECVRLVSEKFSPATLVAVRSSALAEDGVEESMAGTFCSVLNVPSDSEVALTVAVEQVCASLVCDDDQIIVQTMVGDVSMSGVLMTRSLDDGSPYYAINYDDASGRTDTVTGGLGGSKTVFVYRNAKDPDFDSKRLLAVVALARSLESAFDGAPLDMEFAVDKQNKAFLLQARRIAAARNWNIGALGKMEGFISDRISLVADFVEQLMEPRHGLWGRKSILGVMPDWNPAEMIGIHPRPLASGLYRELITRDTWRLARKTMGYQPLPPAELMVMVAGRPYIDVRASFNSFLPSGIHSHTGEKMVNAFLQRLDANPSLHDKVKFEIVPTVLTPDFTDTFRSRYNDTLSVAELTEYKVCLGVLTRSAFGGESLRQAISHIEKLRGIQESTLEIEPAKAEKLRPFDLALHMTGILEECRTLGTLPFAVLARHGFIAETWLRAIIQAGAMDEARVTALKQSIETVSGALTRDFHAALTGRLGKEAFLRQYGHLRPGMYDILSPAYRDRADLFEVRPDSIPLPPKAPQFSLTGREKQALDSLFDSCGFSLGSKAFLQYVRNAVTGREYGKFIFSRHVDHILYLMKLWGKYFEFSPKEVSLLSPADILSMGFQPLPTDGRAYFQERVQAGRREYELGHSFKLSWIIRSPGDVYIVPQHRSQPNFIGRRFVEADVAVLALEEQAPDLEGKIICIESADPGYDWIFTRNIAGLITRYGGTNSHMAIRCAEYGLPAAIGCGDQLFETAAACKRLRMDCAAKIIQAAEGLLETIR